MAIYVQSTASPPRATNERSTVVTAKIALRIALADVVMGSGNSLGERDTPFWRSWKVGRFKRFPALSLLGWRQALREFRW